MCKKPPKRRKVGDTLTATVLGGAGTYTYQWYADDEAIANATEGSFTVTSEQLGKAISVTVTDAEYDVAESADTAKVEPKDLSAEITLKDNMGLQEDGTALETDTLSIEFGSELGVPYNIVWYCNGAVQGAFSLQGGDLVDGMNTAKIELANGGLLKAGKWYVTVENTSGNVFTSNSITVTEIGVAIVSGVSAEDDYDTPAVTLAAASGEMILNMTLNKAYNGVVYVAEKNKKDKYNTGMDMIAYDLGSVDAGIGDATLTPVAKVSGLTNKAATAGVAAADGLAYVDEEGAEHIKFVISKSQQVNAGAQTLTRGKDYVLIFDQDGISTDNLGAGDTKAEDLNITEFTAPYVVAPTSIEVTDKQATVDTAGWSAQLYVGEDKAEFLNTVAATKADNKIELYSDTSTAVDGTKFAGTLDTFLTKGALVSTAGGTTKTSAAAAAQATDGYVYAKFTGAKGIYGTDKLSLTSEVVALPDAIATTITLASSATDPHDLVVTFDNLKNPASVYLLTADWDTNKAKTAKAAVADFKDDETAFVAVATVKKGQASLTFDDVIDGINNTDTYHDAYTIVVVPNNQDDYRDYGRSDAESAAVSIQIDQVETSYSIADGTTWTTNGVTGVDLKNKLKAYDQFGDAMASGTQSVFASEAMTPTTQTASTTVAFTTDADGKITMEGAAEQYAVGDTFTLALNESQTLVAKCGAASNATGVGGVFAISVQ